MPRLLMLDADGAVRQVALRLGENKIGRAPENQIVVDAADTSRAHALITVGDAFVTIQDLGSRNGTFVNGHTVTDQVLADGDIIALGSYEMKFVVATQEFSKIEALEMLTMDGLVIHLPPQPSGEKETAPVAIFTSRRATR